MMINKRIIGTVAESKKYIAGNVVLQWSTIRIADTVYSVKHGILR